MRTEFLVQDPIAVMPSYKFRTDSTSAYNFAWVGSMSPGYADVYTHMADCSVEYISDVRLGTVLVERTSFSGWESPNNKILSGLFPSGPSFQVYRADSDPKAYGTLLRD